jgi:hypothetical protein
MICLLFMTHNPFFSLLLLQSVIIIFIFIFYIFFLPFGFNHVGDGADDTSVGTGTNLSSGLDNYQKVTCIYLA